jgi:Transposase DDE domain
VLQVTALAWALQTLFTTTAEQLARLTNFIRRRRKLTGPRFAQVLVFEWISDPSTTFETLARKLDLTPQGLDQRLSSAAWTFLKQLLRQALRAAHHARRQPQGLFDRFTAVIVEDSTSIALPASLAADFPGCGGSNATDGAAALKILLRWNLRTGEILTLRAYAGRTADRHLATDPRSLPDGSLYLADLGFFRLEHRRAFAAGKFWISRVGADTRVNVDGRWQRWSEWLRDYGGSLFDGPARLGKTDPLACRLIARRCPPEIAATRRRRCHARAKKSGRGTASGWQLAACDWQLWATNVPGSVLSASEVDTVYRCRWQIELFFKRAKSLGGWGVDPRRRELRVLIELWAKLLGVVVMHWAALLGGGVLAGVSLWKLMRVVQEYGRPLRRALQEGETAWLRAWNDLGRELARVPRQRPSKRKPLAFQTLTHAASTS